MKIILLHPTGNANVRAAVKAIEEADILQNFYTTIATFYASFIGKLGCLNLFSELQRRQFDNILQSKTKIYPWLEIGRLLASKAGINNLIRHEYGIFCIDSVNRNLDNHVSNVLKEKLKKHIDGIYAYEDGAYYSFQTAKIYGIKCFYELPIGYWRSGRKLLYLEKEKWPEWANTITGLKDSKEKLLRKDKEIELANFIFVASSFTAKTLADFPGHLPPVKVVPYGFPPIFKNRNYNKIINRRIKLLFVGSLSQRKGIANLFTAVQSMNKFIELTIVGNKVTEDCLPLNAALLYYNWFPSLPHRRVLQLMREHDVLVFPSLFEGFGLVITEAMSQGMPVITTERTAGPDFIKSGKSGWIVEAGSTEDLQKTIEVILSNPDCISEIGFEAMKVAAQRPWEVYGKELAESILKIC